MKRLGHRETPESLSDDDGGKEVTPKYIFALFVTYRKS